MTMEFKNKEDIQRVAQAAQVKANNEPNQDSYNAAWLHGYANALKDVADGFNIVTIAQHYERQCMLEDAASQLARFFGIEPVDVDVDPGACQLCEDTLGYSWDEACNISGEHYILPILVLRFEKAKDCNVADNDTWHTVISQFIKDQPSTK